MKLEIYNFRCYRDNHTFELDDHGITLISGESGVGKTSIMMAIFFVITGNAPPKVISDGCETCRVTLYWKQWKITRTKRPNRVTVLDSTTSLLLEDDVAEQYIRRCFGKHFDYTSYIQQQYQKTFLFLSPTEKLEILEKLCFDRSEGDLHPETVKKQCTLFLREMQNRHTEQKGRLLTLEGMISTPVEAPVAPSTILENKNVEDLRASLVDLRNQLRTHDQLCYLDEQLILLSEKISQVPEVKWSEEDLEVHIHSMKQIHSLTFHEALWTNHSKDDCVLMIEDYVKDIAHLIEYKETEEQIQRLQRFAVELEQVEQEYEKVRQIHEGEYSCPECNTDLMLLNDELIRLRRSKRVQAMNTDHKRKKLAQLDEQIQTLRGKVHSLEHYLERQRQLEELIDPQEDVKTLESDLSWLRQYYATQMDMESQNKVFTQQQRKLKDQTIPGLSLEHAQELSTQIRQQKDLRMQSEALKLKRSQISVSGTQDKTIILHEIKMIEDEIRVAENLKQFNEIFSLKQADYERYLQHTKDVESLRRTLGDLEAQMNALAEVKQLAFKVESEIIQRKISDISSLVNLYAKQIFVEPITIELRTIKKTSTNNEKVQVQLEVFYKNMQCDVSLLSGGEQARLNLAFILAFAHVFETPLLLLDECTSNLDQDLTEIVLTHIESIGIPKIILIAHQVVEGNFSQILKLQVK